MVNNRAGSHRVKDMAIAEINSKFGPLLEKRLNHEDLINSNNITYEYGNVSLTFSNVAKDFELSNDTTKGLEVHLLFGLPDFTENCTSLPKDFD